MSEEWSLNSLLRWHCFRIYSRTTSALWHCWLDKMGSTSWIFTVRILTGKLQFFLSTCKVGLVVSLAGPTANTRNFWRDVTYHVFLTLHVEILGLYLNKYLDLHSVYGEFITQTRVTRSPDSFIFFCEIGHSISNRAVLTATKSRITFLSHLRPHSYCSWSNEVLW
jgi:hypothetical protein